jgi:hypothetical protein
MKDKILGIIKDNKANVTLFLVVVVISVVLFQLSFVYKAQTKKLQDDKVRLGNDTQQINATQFRLDGSNNSLAKTNDEVLKAGFIEYYGELIESYNHDQSAVVNMRAEDVQDKFFESLESLRNICASSSVELSEEFKFSFNDEVSRIFKMEPRDKVKVMEQLMAVENLVKIIASSSVKSITSIGRPNVLAETVVKESYAKVYTFSLVLQMEPGSFGSILNKITNDKQFYYRINSVRLVTDAQVDKDLNPLNLSKKVEEEVEDKKPVAQSIDDLLTGIKHKLPIDEEVEVEEKPKERVNIKAFEAPLQTVTISLDWIQFKETYLEK